MKTTNFNFALLFMTLIMSTSLKAQEQVQCKLEVTCAVYKNGVEIGHNRCFEINNSGKVKPILKEKLEANLSLQNAGGFDISFAHTRQNSTGPSFDSEELNEWFYNIIQVENIDHDHYRLKAGLVFTKSNYPISKRDLNSVDRYLNLSQTTNKLNDNKIINIKQRKDQELVIRKRVMIPLKYKDTGKFKRMAVNALTSAIFLPLQIFQKLTQGEKEDKSTCQQNNDQVVKKESLPGLTLMAKDIVVTCSKVQE